MTDEQPRQLLPDAQRLGLSRPLPPRSRSRVTVAIPDSKSKSQVTSPATPEVADQVISDGNEHTSLRSEADLEGRGTASPTHTPFHRSVSAQSVQSHRSASEQHAQQPISKEDIEVALQGLDRDDLVIALGRAKVQMDDVDARLEEQILENETLRASLSALNQQAHIAEAETQSLKTAVKQREDRIDEIMADQDRMEGEVYSTMQVIERLRSQLFDTERSRNDAEKRYLDQTATMDKERQHYADTETLLKAQKLNQATAYEKLLSSHSELLKEHERTTNKLASIQSTTARSTGEHDALGIQFVELDRSSAGTTLEVPADGDASDDLTVEGMRSTYGPIRSVQSRILSEETELIELREELLHAQKTYASLSENNNTLRSELRDVRADNISLRDQNETFMNILQEKTFSGALLNDSAMLRNLRASSDRHRASSGLMDPYDSDEPEPETASRSGEAESDSLPATIHEEDEGDVDDVPDTPVSKTKASRERKNSNSLLVAPTNLASELEQIAETSDGANNTPRRERKQSDRTGVISDNMDELQTEVRELREVNQALTLYISKIIDRIIAKEGYETILAIESRGGTMRGTRREASQSKTRPTLQSVFDPPAASEGSSSTTSGGFFGFGAAPAARPKTRRGASIDWRSIPFLGGGNATDSGANLKPLTLQSDSLLIPPRDLSARKLRTSEEIEDEQDTAERDQIRNELARRGIQPPDSQLNSSSSRKSRPQNISVLPSTGASGFAAFFSRVVGNGPSSLLSPARSDTASQPSSTPIRTTKQEPVHRDASTPLDPEKRRIGRDQAWQLSTGGAETLTNPSGSQAVATRARQMRPARYERSIDDAAESLNRQSSSGSVDRQTVASGVTSSSTSTADGTMSIDDSVAGDESYCLPPHTHQAVTPARSPLLDYGAALPPLPHETTGDEDPDAYRSPTLSTQPPQFLSSSQEQGWKKALRRISYLSSSSNPTNSTSDGAAPSLTSPIEYVHSPVSAHQALLSSSSPAASASSER